ncbi:hypothetical protein N7457_004132 [Penicillium paradoxum]|uniref:uncharacterized protein n=1 Tax=Penicillium paradoxum TaxID=176176 RepID=UPI0025487AC3|nr:uncharacterized protein N7457_004132 [Penicillium paradoxum]KAJ5782358.1 hypothetical protein N7457_004132 [Penicillium paradoxum]
MSSASEGSDWQQVRHYSDHLGHAVVLERHVASYTPDPSDLVPIQIYSLVPLDADHEQLRAYLMHSFFNEEVLPLFEIYSYCPPDPFTCIEHHRREIAHRKQQHRSGVSNPPPLIPLFFCSSSETPIAICVLLRSHSHRLGYTNQEDNLAEAGEGPDFLHFNRCFSSTRSHVDEVQRASYPPGELTPEAFELSTERMKCQTDVGQTIMNEIFLNAGNPFLQYAMDVDEGEPTSPNPESEEQIHQQIIQQIAIGGFFPSPAFQIAEDAGIVSITNTPKDAEPDLQYLIYASFLSHLRNTPESSLLKSTARLFTAALLSNLPAQTTVNLTFSIPESMSWSAIHPAHALSQVTDLRIGALHTFSANEDETPAPHRIPPSYPHDSIYAARVGLSTPYRVFAVVLDRANFVSEAGIYFYMADWDASNDPDPFLEVCPDDAEVRRCVGMSEAARRLAMLAVDEAQSY